MQGIKGRKEGWAPLRGEVYPQLFCSLPYCGWHHRNGQRLNSEGNGFARSDNGEHLRHACPLALAALRCRFRLHGMLTVGLAAVLRRLHSADFPSHASKTGPRGEKVQDRDRSAYCPEAVSLDVHHGADITIPSLAQRFCQSLFCLSSSALFVPVRCHLRVRMLGLSHATAARFFAWFLRKLGFSGRDVSCLQRTPVRGRAP